MHNRFITWFLKTILKVMLEYSVKQRLTNASYRLDDNIEIRLKALEETMKTLVCEREILRMQIEEL